MTRRLQLRIAGLALGLAVFGDPYSWAHHSFANTYSNETVTIQGTVIEFLYRNPHSVVLVETTDDRQNKILWAAEWGTAGQLSRLGIEKDTLRPGDHVVVSGNPSVNTRDHRMRMGEISRPADGWRWKSDM